LNLGGFLAAVRTDKKGACDKGRIRSRQFDQKRNAVYLSMKTLVVEKAFS